MAGRVVLVPAEPDHVALFMAKGRARQEAEARLAAEPEPAFRVQDGITILRSAGETRALIHLDGARFLQAHPAPGPLRRSVDGLDVFADAAGDPIYAAPLPPGTAGTVIGLIDAADGGLPAMARIQVTDGRWSGWKVWVPQSVLEATGFTIPAGGSYASSSASSGSTGHYCGATTRKGGSCRRWVVNSDRCYQH